MKVQIAFLLLLISCHCGWAQQKTYNIKDYGAIGDGLAMNTVSIQKAIDEAAKNGGGNVLFPPGRFLTGVIELKSGVTIHLAEGAALLATARRIDYGAEDASALIVATNQHNIGITGKGTIDGQANELLKDIYVMLNAGTLKDSEWKTENPWHQVRPEERNRPKIIEFKNCDSIAIRGVFIKDGLCWVQNYQNCSNLVVDSIHVESNTFWNNDGIDLVDCKNVRLTHSFFNADDDGICLKSEDRDRRCENIYIADCRIRSSASGLKFGTASRGGFKNIRVRNITVFDTYRSAIALEAVDGGVLEDVDIRNVVATNTGNALFIRLGHRNKDSVISKVRRIHISNVKAAIPSGKPDKGYSMEGPLLRYPHNVFPSSIAGLAANPVEEVVLDSIEIVYEGGASKDSAFVSVDSLHTIPENPTAYPEFSMFGELPAWGFYCRHVNGLTMKNIAIKYQKEDFRSAMVFDDVHRIGLEKISIRSGKSVPVIVLRKSKADYLKNIQLPVNDRGAIKTVL